MNWSFTKVYLFCRRFQVDICVDMLPIAIMQFQFFRRALTLTLNTEGYSVVRRLGVLPEGISHFAVNTRVILGNGVLNFFFIIIAQHIISRFFGSLHTSIYCPLICMVTYPQSLPALTCEL